MDVLKVVSQDTERNKRQPERDWYKVEPGKMYPAMIEFIVEQLDNENEGDGIIRSQYYPAARSLPPNSWELALVPRQEVTKQTDLALRAQALELARIWFTELLHRSLRWQALGVKEKKIWATDPPPTSGASLGFQITKDERWKL